MHRYQTELYLLQRCHGKCELRKLLVAGVDEVIQQFNLNPNLLRFTKILFHMWLLRSGVTVSGADYDLAYDKFRSDFTEAAFGNSSDAFVTQLSTLVAPLPGNAHARTLFVQTLREHLRSLSAFNDMVVRNVGGDDAKIAMLVAAANLGDWLDRHVF